MEINENLVIVIIGLISLGFGYLTYFLNKYTDKVNAEIKNIRNQNERELFENALKDVHDIVLKAVTTAEQVTVKSIKNSSMDGKLSEEDIKNVGSEVFNNVLENLTSDTKNILSKNIVDLDKYVKSAIETSVYNINK